MLNKDQQEQFKRDYNNLSIPNLSAKYEISIKHVEYYAKKLGLNKKQRLKVSDYQYNFIKSNTEMSNYMLSLCTGLSWRSVNIIKTKIKEGVY